MIADNQALRYITYLENIMTCGFVSNPRGMETKELLDCQLIVDPNYPFMTFTHRKYDVDYFKKEMRWKLTANKYDESIKQHAKMWSSVQNPDGTYNSNYGQYWFGPQMGLFHVVTELIRDRYSRRAIIPMLSTDHIRPETIDTVCTEGVAFHIRDRKLFMSIHMRSSDAVFGLGTDIPTFAFLYRLVFGLLADHYLDLCLGHITITMMSGHIYSRHYDMVNDIISNGVIFYDPVEMPWISATDAMAIVSCRGNRPCNSSQIIDWLFQ